MSKYKIKRVFKNLKICVKKKIASEQNPLSLTRYVFSNFFTFSSLSRRIYTIFIQCPNQNLQANSTKHYCALRSMQFVYISTHLITSILYFNRELSISQNSTSEDGHGKPKTLEEFRVRRRYRFVLISNKTFKSVLDAKKKTFNV